MFVTFEADVHLRDFLGGRGGGQGKGLAEGNFGGIFRGTCLPGGSRCGILGGG